MNDEPERKEPTKPLWDAPKVEALKEAIAARKSAAAAAREIGCSRHAATRKARKLGLRFMSVAPKRPRKPRGLSSARRVQLEERRALASLERDWRTA